MAEVLFERPVIEPEQEGGVRSRIESDDSVHQLVATKTWGRPRVKRADGGLDRLFKEESDQRIAP